MKNDIISRKKHPAAEYIAAVIGVAAAVGLLVFPKAVSGAMRESISDCLEVVIPSLFAFTALALWLQKSGIYRTALRFLTIPLSRLLRMDEELCAVFVLSNIGGFPTGMKLLSELAASGRLSRKDAGRMLCCCFGSGPSFIIGIVGLKVFGSIGAGFVLFAASFASSLAIAAIVRMRGEISLKKADETAPDLSADCFISSVIGSAKVMFTVCAMIVGFSAVTALLREIGVLELMARLFPSEDVLAAALEITRIKGMAPSNAALPLCAALLSFGGICVHLQLAALGRGIPMRGIPMRSFMLSRVVAVAVSAGFALPFSRKFAVADMPVLAPQGGVEFFTKNAILSLCVLLMCVILIWEHSKIKNK